MHPHVYIIDTFLQFDSRIHTDGVGRHERLRNFRYFLTFHRLCRICRLGQVFVSDGRCMGKHAEVGFVNGDGTVGSRGG